MMYPANVTAMRDQVLEEAIKRDSIARKQHIQQISKEIRSGIHDLF